MNIGIIDYGMGNIASVASAIHYLGVSAHIVKKPADLEIADGYIVPGVGAFPAAMRNLREMQMIRPLARQVLDIGRPFLGICLGMQLLAKDSTEKGFSEGLGWIDANVVKLDPRGDLRVPHVGWNTVKTLRETALFERVEDDSHFFFDHSFCMTCSDTLVVATCDYGGEIVAAIQKGNIMATQFHPEKSQRNGLKMLRSFLNLVGDTKTGHA
jgi:imidazole glycerol-phosphate synthase subunit HisH